MKLPRIPQSQIDVQPVDWLGLPTRYMNPGEMEALIALVRSVNPKGVLEFGVNTGRTARMILENVAGIERYQGVDVPKGYVPAMKVQRNEVPDQPGYFAEDDPRFELILRPRGSHDLCADELAPCDAVFIDGDHSRAGVEQDFALANAVIRKGGIIVFHDYHDLGTVDVRDVLDEWHDKGLPLVAVENTWLAFTRV